MAELRLHARHVYAHDPSELEKELNEALRRIVDDGGVVGDVKYAIDPSSDGARGGFGALIIFELPTG